jgi:hypothetical protein
MVNGTFESLDEKGNPKGWDLSYYQRNRYETALDTVIEKQGRYSVSISSKTKPIMVRYLHAQTDTTLLEN